MENQTHFVEFIIGGERHRVTERSGRIGGSVTTDEIEPGQLYAKIGKLVVEGEFKIVSDEEWDIVEEALTCNRANR